VKGEAISILKDSFSRNFTSIKIIPITEAKIKSILFSPKPEKNHPIMMK
jgi:hypothetical protein